MSTWLRSQTTVPSNSGIARDAVVWSFAWYNPSTTTDEVADATEIANRCNSLLQAVSTSGAGKDYTIAPYMVPSEAQTEIYDLTDARPRIPIHVMEHSSLGLPVNTGVEFPPEVALCVSFEGPRQSGQPQARRRGRWYFGPLVFNGTSGTDQRVPTTTGMTALLTAFTGATDPAGNDGPYLSVYSRYTHGNIPVGGSPPADQPFPEDPELLAESFTLVTHLWIDSAWDTQRRRGHAAATRVEGSASARGIVTPLPAGGARFQRQRVKA